MNMVLEKNEQGSQPLFTDGPLIHNPQTIEMLQRRGVRVLEQGRIPQPGDMVFIRSHGISPQRRQELRDLGVNLCDATCPDVARIQGLIRRQRRAGYTIVIVGDKNHAEVIGLEGYADGGGHVVSGPEEVADLPPADKVCVVAQSTLYPEILEKVADAVRKRYSEALILDTICPSTYLRQKELQELARTADAVVVVGGRNSANTRRLARISRDYGTPTFHVETAEEIDVGQMQQFRTVGVTAGASTPNWILMQTVEKLRSIEHAGSSPLLRWLHRAGRFMVKSDLLIATGAAMLCLANATLMGITLGWVPYAAAFAYILSVHLLTHFTDQGAFETSLSRLTAMPPYQKRFFMALSAVSAAAALFFTALKGSYPFLIILILTVLGAIYRLDIVTLRVPLGKRHYSLRLIPASKDLFMALGWSVATVFLPLLMADLPISTPAFYLTFASTFLLVILRSLFFDIRDLQGDQLVGRETLPILIGLRNTKLLIATLVCLQAALLALGAAEGWLTGFGYLMLVVSSYICLYLYLYHRRRVRQSISVEIMGDMQFILAGILALIYHMA
jgi:(E)-4-hydroxy-3-methyl-but-2-enyl pyrophosphate reductase